MRLLKSSIIGFTAIIAAVSCQDYTPFWGEEGEAKAMPKPTSKVVCLTLREQKTG